MGPHLWPCGPSPVRNRSSDAPELPAPASAKQWAGPAPWSAEQTRAFLPMCARAHRLYPSMRPELMDVMGGDLCATAVVHMHPTALCALRATSPRLRTCVEQAAKMICRRMGRRGHRRGTVWCKVLSHMSRAALAKEGGRSATLHPGAGPGDGIGRHR